MRRFFLAEGPAVSELLVDEFAEVVSISPILVTSIVSISADEKI